MTADSRIPPWAIGCVLITLAVVAHGRSLVNGFIWDDDAYVTENKTIRSVDGLRQIWLDPKATPQFYPLVHTSYWIEYHVWGLNPLGYHAINVALHATSAVLLWRVFVRLKVPASSLCAALFAVHPVGVESVAWVTERKNTLSIVFGLLTVLSWLRYRCGVHPFGTDESGVASEDVCCAAGRQRWLAISVACFLCALLSKTVVVMVIGHLILIVWWKTGRVRRSDIIALVPLVMVGAPLAFATVWLEKYHVGASNVDFQLSMIDRILIAGRAVVFYAGKLIWPNPLAFFYTRWAVDPRVIWQWAFPAAVTGTFLALWHYRAAIGRAPFATVAMFCCGLFPALGFVDVFPFKYSYVADHFQYHAMPIGLAGIGAAAMRVMSVDVVRWLAVAGCAALTGLAAQRCGVFHDQETLYLDTLAKTPSCAIAAHNLGTWYLENGRREEAAELLRRGAELAQFPDERSRSFTNLATLALQGNEAAEAVSWASQAVRYEPGTRGWAVMALALARNGDIRRAEQILATLRDKSSQEALLALAECALHRGDLTSAMSSLASVTVQDTAEKLNHALLEAGVALATHGHFQQADVMFQQIAGDPRAVCKAQVNLGISAVRRGDLDSAAQAFQTAVEADPASSDARGNLGKILAAKGDFERAVIEFKIAERLAGNHFAFQEDYERALKMRSQSLPR